MANQKKRTKYTMMEEESRVMARKKIPSHWVMHTYEPDYGIDFIVEVFEKTNPKNNTYDTLGELFFVQLKSVAKTKIIKKRFCSRINVEKEIKIRPDEYVIKEVITFPIDAGELLMVQAMGSALPVLLLLADLQTNEMYFLCLNDYIEKILVYEKPNFSDQGKVTIHIPIDNRISDDKRVISQLAFYARRAKLFGAFEKFYYQSHELKHNPTTELLSHFIKIIKRYDFWHAEVKWPALQGLYEDIIFIESLLSTTDSDKRKEQLIKKYKNDAVEYLVTDDAIVNQLAVPLWGRLTILSRMYEELCKEWYLPSYMWLEIYSKEQQKEKL